MKLRSPQGRVTLGSIRPSAAVSSWYDSYLKKLIVEMRKDVEQAILAEYSKNPSKSKLDHLINGLNKTWGKFFNAKADALARGLVVRSLRHYDQAFNAELKSAKIPSRPIPKKEISALGMDALPKLNAIKFQITDRLQETIDRGVRDNVDLITSVPTEYLDSVRSRVREAVEKGRDTEALARDLRERFDITARRARTIATDQNNKITAQINQTRQRDLGITQAVWIHTAASLNPRESHAEFNGEVYDVEEGVDFDDGFGPVLPGEAINCGCLSRSIIPGYDDEE